MTRYNATEKQAFNQQHKKAPVATWYVKQGTMVLFENASIQLCWAFIKLHSLRTKPTSIK